MKLAIFLVLVFLAMTAEASEKQPAADTVFLHGNIWTGVPGAPRAQAIAVREGRILAVGNDKDISRFRNKKTKIVDLGERFVMPGFNDAHVHLANGGLEHLGVDLVGTHSLQEMLDRIAPRAQQTPNEEWIQGGGWDHTKWNRSASAEPALPTRTDLDRVTGTHPALFWRVDGHIVVVNSVALRIAGITRETPNPAGAEIDRDAQGEPTGILREDAAINLVLRKIPEPTPSTRRRGIEIALAEAAEAGITSIQDNSPWAAFLIYEEMEREGKLTVRISEWLNFDDDIKTLSLHRAHHPATDAMLHTGMLKAFMDGSLGSRTAALLAPYADDPGNKGLPRYEIDKLKALAVERGMAGFQMGFHAIGDEGAEMALNAFDETERYLREHGARKNAAQGSGAWDFRYRIEHAQVVTPQQLDRMAALGVIASVQPNHLLTDMEWAQSRLGPERARHSYPWRDMQKKGIRLAFGTDYPVEPIAPFRGIYAAVTRKNEAGTRSYYPEQAVDREAALAMYTSGGAFAEFAEREKGTLAPGMLADFVVLDRDLVKCRPEEILTTHVLRTVVGGKTVWEKP